LISPFIQAYSVTILKKALTTFSGIFLAVLLALLLALFAEFFQASNHHCGGAYCDVYFGEV